MGLFSSIASGALTKGLAVGKASLIAAMPPIVVAIFAFIFWNERLTIIQLLAFLVLTGGLVIIRYSNDINFRNPQGVQWGVMALFFFAFNDLSGKWSIVLEVPRYPTLMFLTGSLFFYIIYLLDRKKEKGILIKAGLNIGHVFYS